jgi:hypothetical protein
MVLAARSYLSAATILRPALGRRSTLCARAEFRSSASGTVIDDGGSRNMLLMRSAIKGAYLHLPDLQTQ